MSKKKTTKESGEKIMKVNIDSGGPGFFSDSIAIFHNPRNFVLDFQQTTPRLTRLGSEKPQQTLYVRHNTVILDPYVTKDLLKILQENVKKYEDKFGKIEMKSKTRRKSSKVDHTKSYIG